MSADTTASVHLEIEIDAPPERAVQVFTQRFDRIKPRDHNLLAADIAETVLEPWPGGRLYDRGAGGTICRWGRVLAVEAPNRLVFTWDISPAWTLEPDPARCSEVEVAFSPLDGGRRTRSNSNTATSTAPCWPVGPCGVVRPGVAGPTTDLVRPHRVRKSRSPAELVTT